MNLHGFGVRNFLFFHILAFICVKNVFIPFFLFNIRKCVFRTLTYFLSIGLSYIYI